MYKLPLPLNKCVKLGRDANRFVRFYHSTNTIWFYTLFFLTQSLIHHHFILQCKTKKLQQNILRALPEGTSLETRNSKVSYQCLAGITWQNVSQNRELKFQTLKQAEKYLFSVLYPKESCDTFGELWYILYTKKNKTLSSLLPASNMSTWTFLRSHYVVLICSNLISAPGTNLNPVEFGWNSVDSVLKPDKCIVTLP